MMKLEDGRNWFNMSKKVEDSWLWWVYGWITVFSLWRVMEGSGWSAKWPPYTNFQTMIVAESVALVTNVPSKTVCFMHPLGLGHSFFFSNYASTSVLLSAEDFLKIIIASEPSTTGYKMFQLTFAPWIFEHLPTL